MASAFVLSGINVGGFTGAPLVAYLLREYGFRGATLIIAAITLHVCFSATVFHPVEWHIPRRGNDKVRAPIKPKNKRTMVSTLTSYWRLLKSARTYVIIVPFAAIGGIMRTAISLVPLVLETNGHTQEDAAFITSILGICGFVGRLVVSSVADTAWFNVRVGYIACISVAIVSLIGNVQVHPSYNSSTYYIPSNHRVCCCGYFYYNDIDWFTRSFLSRIPHSLHRSNKI